MIGFLRRTILLSTLLMLLIGGTWYLFLKQPPLMMEDLGPAALIVHLDDSGRSRYMAYLFDPTELRFHSLGDAGYAVWSPQRSYLATMVVGRNHGYRGYGGLVIWETTSWSKTEVTGTGDSSFQWSPDEGYFVKSNLTSMGPTYEVEVWSGDGKELVWHAFDTSLMGGHNKNCYRFCSPIRWEGNQLVMVTGIEGQAGALGSTLWRIDIASNKWTLLASREEPGYWANLEREAHAWQSNSEELRATAREGVEFAIENDKLIVREVASGWTRSVALPLEDGRIEYVIWSPRPQE